MAAAGRNPRDVARRGGRTVTTYLRRAGSIRDTGELERTILVLRACGLSPRRFRGRNLAAALLRRRRSNGSWQGNVAFTAFGIFALRAARSGSTSGSARWLAGAQNEDGGFGFVPRAESDVDDTGAALQALAAAGMRSTRVTRRAVAYLRGAQNRDGGFGQMEGRDSNAQSTAWAVQGLVAAGRRPESMGANPIRFLLRLQRRDGHIAYSRSSDQTPVWVTAQALTALRRKAFPLAAVPRAKVPPHRRGRASAPRTTKAKAAPSKRRGRRSASRKARRDKGASPRRASRAAEQRARPERTSAETAAGPAEEEGTSVPAALVVGAIAGALLAVGVLRRRLRGKRLQSRG